MSEDKDKILRLMFEYASLDQGEIQEICAGLDKKILRWLGSHHPDNMTRKLFFQLTSVEIGAGTVLNSGLVISDGYLPLVKFGERVAVSPNVTIIAQSGSNNSKLQNLPCIKDRLIVEAPVCIDDDVWIGASVVILPGVTIGKMSVIGAGAVVTKSIPPYTISSGVPATINRILGCPG
ncbi:acyltransferase [Dechloromonas hankyongensis]|uniref:acyltransferase n=1 Tax=Dechloromonas hankyongensis TaxID=2908002 RepID=UPI0023DABF5D|nr:acyltransferase [Dechloromonas hankyongensis]